MARARSSAKSSSQVLTGSEFSHNALVYTINANTVRLKMVRGLVRNSGDTTTNTKYDHTFSRNQLAVTGTLTSGSVFGLSSMESGSFVSVNITASSGHTFTGQMILSSCSIGYARNDTLVRVSMAGLFNGSVTESVS